MSIHDSIPVGARLLLENGHLSCIYGTIYSTFIFYYQQVMCYSVNSTIIVSDISARFLNDHRLEDGGFVDRLKPTKGKGMNPILVGS